MSNSCFSKFLSNYSFSKQYSLRQIKLYWPNRFCSLRFPCWTIGFSVTTAETSETADSNLHREWLVVENLQSAFDESRFESLEFRKVELTALLDYHDSYGRFCRFIKGPDVLLLPFVMADNSFMMQNFGEQVWTVMKFEHTIGWKFSVHKTYFRST